MRHAGRVAIACLACLLPRILTMPASAESPLEGKARLEALSFSDLAGWPDDDHG